MTGNDIEEKPNVLTQTVVIVVGLILRASDLGLKKSVVGFHAGVANGTHGKICQKGQLLHEHQGTER